jgi:hypothetical protein
MVTGFGVGGTHTVHTGQRVREGREMVLVFVAAAWVASSVPIALVLARVISGPHSDLYGMDGTNVLYRFPNGSVERFALLRPVPKR